MNKIANFINDKNCFDWKTIKLRTNGVEIPYNFKTPRPFSANQLKIVGDIGSELIIKYNNSNLNNLHIIAVASMGIHIATSIALCLNSKGINVNLSLIKPNKNNYTNLNIAKDDNIIIIDNTIATGKTLKKVIYNLRIKYTVKINMVLHLYDFLIRDNNIDPIKKLEKELKVPIYPIFNFFDLILYYYNTDTKKFDILFDLAKDFGTKKLNTNLQKFISQKLK